MTLIEINGSNGTKALDRMKRDPIIRNLRDKTPDEVIEYLQNATPGQRDAVYQRIVILALGLLTRSAKDVRT